jgi:anti-sigma factor (TIGR02949 family)
LLTCKQFLQELNDFLDDSVAEDTKRSLQAHVAECPNCFVIVDTTRRTLEIYKCTDPQPIPENVKSRLWEALERKMAARKGPPTQH